MHKATLPLFALAGVVAIGALQGCGKMNTADVKAASAGAHVPAIEPRPGEERVFEIARGVNMTFCWIPATTSDAWKQLSRGRDTFTMGSPESEAERDGSEAPHEVRLTRGFWLGKYEVTQSEWQAVMGSNPSYVKGARNPVEMVSWNDCQAFLGKLNNRTYRLPTEAEWEYACRAGTATAFCCGDSLDSVMANFDGNYPYGNGQVGVDRHRPVDVGSFRPNAWGLHNMHGNVWEWCSDWQGDYPSGVAVDPSGPPAGKDRVNRGGSWGASAGGCRSAFRGGEDPGGRFSTQGFRLVKDAP